MEKRINYSEPLIVIIKRQKSFKTSFNLRGFECFQKLFPTISSKTIRVQSDLAKKHGFNIYCKQIPLLGPHEINTTPLLRPLFEKPELFPLSEYLLKKLPQIREHF